MATRRCGSDHYRLGRKMGQRRIIRCARSGVPDPGLRGRPLPATPRYGAVTKRSTVCTLSGAFGQICSGHALPASGYVLLSVSVSRLRARGYVDSGWLVIGRRFVLSRHAGQRWPGIAFGCVAFVLAFPRIWLLAGPDRWGWLAITMLAGLMLFRMNRIGRVVLAGETLKVWTVLRVRRYAFHSVAEATIEQPRMGLLGMRRNVFVLIVEGSPVRFPDINVEHGSGGLNALCDQVNRAVRGGAF